MTPRRCRLRVRIRCHDGLRHLLFVDRRGKVHWMATAAPEHLRRVAGPDLRFLPVQGHA